MHTYGCSDAKLIFHVWFGTAMQVARTYLLFEIFFCLMARKSIQLGVVKEKARRVEISFSYSQDRGRHELMKEKKLLMKKDAGKKTWMDE
jgi:hypothetical protein